MKKQGIGGGGILHLHLQSGKGLASIHKEGFLGITPLPLLMNRSNIATYPAFLRAPFWGVF